MKGKRAKVNRIFFSAMCLAVAIALAAFSCFAWFTSNNTVNSDGIDSTVTDAYITNFLYTPYALTKNSESGGTTTYTVGSKYDADTDDEESFAIAGYGSTDAILLVITYNVKGSDNTTITFNGSGSDSSDEVTSTDVPIKTGKDESGKEYEYVETSLSNGISMRLLDSPYATYTTGSSVSSSKTKRCFMDSTAGNVKQEVVFENVTADNTAVTLNILVEYDDENVSELYDLASAKLSYSISFLEDLSIEIVPYEGTHTHTYSKWTVTTYENTSGIALVAEGEDPLYTATRTCTGCAEGTDGHTQSVNITESDIQLSDTDATATVTLDGVILTITFNTVTVGGTTSDSGSSGDSGGSGGTTTTDNYEFSYRDLTTAISEAGVTLTDSMDVTQSYLKYSNSFLTIVDGGTVKVRDGSSTAKTCIEIKGSALSVTFQGTGTITISFASTGTSNTSDIALMDSDNNYITASSTTATSVTVTAGTYYTVSGTTYISVTYNIASAGTYTIVAGINYDRNTRINAITMTDNY